MRFVGHVVPRCFVAGLTLLSIALSLVCGSVAHAQNRTDRSGELQMLVDALGEQIEMQRSFNRAKAEATKAQLQHAIKAWQEGARTDDDFEQMHAWLEEALQASLAGSRKRMPPVPTFNPQVVAQTPKVAPESALPESTTPEPTHSSQPGRSSQVRVSEALPFGEPEPAAEKPQVAPVQPGPATARREEAKPANPWARHPAATPIALGDPFVDDPLPHEPEVAPAVATTPQPLANSLPSDPEETASVDTLKNARVVLRPTASDTVRGDTVGINLAALAARIRGHDRGLRGIEARLIAKPDLRVDDLLLLAKELETLAQQRKLIDLYVDALNPAERSRVTPPESAEPLKQLIGERAKRFRPTSQPDNQVDDVFSEQPSPAVEEIETILKDI